MSDVTAFLNARLDDDEKIANTAIGRQPEYAEWAYEGDEVFAPRLGERGDRWNVTCDSEGLLPAVEEKDGPHIAHHDPARALRDVAAKRGVVREMEAARSSLEERGINVPFFITWTLWHLAAVYSDHPDYRKEWQI